MLGNFAPKKEGAAKALVRRYGAEHCAPRLLFVTRDTPCFDGSRVHADTIYALVVERLPLQVAVYILSSMLIIGRRRGVHTHASYGRGSVLLLSERL